jgi:DNA polymerase III sliding clamp (beta) subunit (PCNA family)
MDIVWRSSASSGIRRPAIAAGEEVKVILPKKTLLELGKLLSESDGDITYERGEITCFSRSAAAC